MKLVSMKCPHCNGALEISPDAKQAKCPFCNTLILIDDEVQHIRFDNSVQAGYDFEVGRLKAQQDVAEQKQKATLAAERSRKARVWWIIGWIVFFPIPLTILIAKSKRLKPAIKLALIAALWVGLVLIGALSESDSESRVGSISESDSESHAIWSAEYTPLEAFEYRIIGDNIVLSKYTGSSKTVNIAPEYEVDGKVLHVTTLEGVFALKRISSAIIPEGVTSIKGNAFNSCGVKHLYLPSTLTDFNGWSYFHKVDALYYGGTEEQWNALYKAKEIDIKQIVFNAKIADLIEAND